MKETGLIFKAPMVRAILEGRKTQTRRVAKPVKHPDLGNLYTPGALAMGREPQHVIDRACPLGQPGDRIYVRETFVQGYKEDPETGAVRDYDEEGNDIPMTTWYRATDGGITWCDDDGWETNVPWKPAIHMPKALARIWLEITGVRVERLQDISHADAVAEGMAFDDAIYDYSKLWEKINGPGAWDANPWVWVIDFRRAAQEGGAA